MSMRDIEGRIIREAREVFQNRTLRIKDLMEWSTNEIKPEAGEVVQKLAGQGVWVAIKSEHDKRKNTNVKK